MLADMKLQGTLEKKWYEKGIYGLSLLKVSQSTTGPEKTNPKKKNIQNTPACHLKTKTTQLALALCIHF